MKKLDKHIQKSNFVKVYLGNDEGLSLRHFEGVIFSYNEDFIFMCELSDFNYDGFVVLRKKDVVDIRYTESEQFFEQILKSENMLRSIRMRKREVPFRLGKMASMFDQLMELELPVIFENLYDDEEAFFIGPIKKVKDDHIKINYFNTVGEFDPELLSVVFDKLTFFRFDSPYANLFYKYADENKVIEVDSNFQTLDPQEDKVAAENSVVEDEDVVSDDLVSETLEKNEPIEVDKKSTEEKSAAEKPKKKPKKKESKKESKTEKKAKIKKQKKAKDKGKSKNKKSEKAQKKSKNKKQKKAKEKAKRNDKKKKKK